MNECLSAVPTTPKKKDKNFEINFFFILCWELSLVHFTPKDWIFAYFLIFRCRQAGLFNRRCRWHRRIIYRRCCWHQWTVFPRCQRHRQKILGFLVMSPWQGLIGSVNDTGDKFFAGVNNTAEQFIKYSFANISANFRKNLKRPQWNTWGPGGHWFMKKTWSRKSRVRLPLMQNFTLMPIILNSAWTQHLKLNEIMVAIAAF